MEQTSSFASTARRDIQTVHKTAKVTLVLSRLRRSETFVARRDHILLIYLLTKLIQGCWFFLNFQFLPTPLITSCAGGRHNMPPPPASWPLTVWPWNDARVTCDAGYLCVNFSLPSSVLDLDTPLSVWPHLFRGAGLWESSWVVPGIYTLEVFHVHSYQDQFIQPVWAECFCVFSLGLCFVCSFALFDLFVCPHSFMFPSAVESSPLQFLALA